MENVEFDNPLGRGHPLSPPIHPIGSALNGVRASLLRQDVAANSIADLQTLGYRACRTEQVESSAGGTRVASILPTFEPIGFLLSSEGAFDLAIEGEGFFVLDSGDGTLAFSRAGDFSTDVSGALVNPDGLPVLPPVTVPPGAVNVSIGQDGTVTATFEDGLSRTVGRLELARFANPEGLHSIGNNLFTATGVSGPPEIGLPGSGGRGEIRFETLEGSNVDLTEQITEQIEALRSLQANLAVIRRSDERTEAGVDLLG